jgi:hypothetical protein
MSLRLTTILMLLAYAGPVNAQRSVLWQPRSHVDWAGGPGGLASAPRPPFHFVKEDSSGTTPKVDVRDARGVAWSVKFGEEVKPEVFAARLVWAMGYYADPVYYVPSGVIRDVKRSLRTGKCIDKQGDFHEARFERRNSSARYLPTSDWTWENNPFAGTHELNGLRILVMLLSNWDNKDAREGSGSNTGILERGQGSARQWIYFISDWGGSMGKWGNYFTREKWDCDGFAHQTPKFVQVDGGELKFGFSGKHAGDFKESITISDVRWLMARLARVSDENLLTALRASGANAHERVHFVRALRMRIDQLRRAAAMRSLYSANL